MLLCSFVFVSPTFALLRSEPVAHRPTIIHDMYDTDVFTGSATYSYDIPVPKGTNDLTPSVSLSYNSLAVRDTKMISGIGWQLQKDYIERDANFTPDNTSDDKFRLFFQGSSYELVYVSGDSRYHTKEESFLNIQKISGDEDNDSGDYWQVITKDGTKYRFGYATNSEFICAGRSYVYQWSMDEVEDVQGNKIFYTYNETSGGAYPSKIEYNTEKTRVIEFLYNANPYEHQVYLQGCSVSETSRLHKIVVKANGNIVHQFDLDFTDAENSQQLLNSITEEGTATASALPATTFQYKPETEKWSSSGAQWLNNAAVDVDLTKDDVTEADVNGDGLLDIVKTQANSAPNVTWKVLLNQGSSWATSFETWVSNADLDDARLDRSAHDVRLVDVTGDSLPDIVKSSEPNTGWATYKVWRNTGSSWSTAAETWVNNANIDADLTDTDVAIMDANGDGLADIIKTVNLGSGNSTWKVYKNTGSSWNTTAETWVNNANINSTIGGSFSTLLDVTGDGLPDIINTSYSGNNEDSYDTWRVYKNIGTAWNTTPEIWINNAHVTAHLETNNIALADANGDGLIDIVKSINQGTADKWEVLLNLGNSWSTTWEVWNDTPDNMDVDAEESNVLLTDVTGDGLPDLIKTENGSGNSTWTVWANSSIAPDALSIVHTSEGGEITFDYANSATSDNTGADSLPDLPFGLWVVDELTKNNGLTNDQEIDDVTTYDYMNGMYDWQDREFRGFGEVSTVEPNGSKKTYVFNQDDAKKGKPIEVQTRDGPSNPYAEIETSWSTASASGVYTVNLTQQKNYTYDGSASNPKIIQTDYDYDSYGNVTKKSDEGDTNISGDERFTYNEYTVNTSDWIVDTVKKTYLNDSDDATKLSETDFYYDGNSGLSDTPTAGDLTKEVKWLDGLFSPDPETEYTYDSFGNIETVTDPNDHTTTYDYDTTGTYQTSITNAKSHVTSATYDLGTGNILSQTDPNSQTTSYEYDTFGRLTKEIKPYDTSTYPSLQYSYFRDGIAPEGVLVSKREVSSSSAALDTYTFTDGLGREIQKQTEAEDTSKHIVKDTYYDPTGEIKKQTVPYLASIMTPTPTPPDYSIQDKTSNGNNLTNSGMTEWTSDTPFAESTEAARAVAASSQYMYAPDSTSLSYTGSMTAEAWVKFDSLPATNQEMFIVSKYRDDNNQISWTFALQEHSGSYRFRSLTSTTGANYEEAVVSWTPSTGTWYHVAMVYDASVPNVKFYVNGTQQGSTQSKTYSSIYNSTAALQIGTINHGGSPSQYLNGKIDEVRIWNVARTQSQIDYSKDQELTGSESGLVAYYPFEDLDESSGTESGYLTPDNTAKVIQWSYDPLARITEVESTDGSSKTIAYDHWKETTTDENSHVKRAYRDAYAHITKVEEELSGSNLTTLYTYNKRDELTAIEDDAHNDYSFTYDTLGRKTAQTDPDMGTWEYEYDAVGNLTKQTDNRGIEVNKTYDEINRLLTTDYPTDTDLAFTYDGNGKKGTMTVATDSAGTVNFLYDNQLRKTEEQRTVNGTTKTTQFSYDPMDRVVTTTYPDSEVVTNTFNAQGEIASVSNTFDAIDYNALGKITQKTFANGAVSDYTYNTTDFRLNRIATDSFQDLSYTYDDVGNVKTIADAVSSATKHFTYDDLDRLKTATSSAGLNEAYSYNSIGNLTSASSSGSLTTYGYDSGGKVHAMTSSSKTVPPPPVGASGTPYTSSLTDNWASGEIDQKKWLNWGDPQTAITSEQLVVTSVTGGGYFGIDSDVSGKLYNLTGTGIVNEVVNAGNQSLGTWEVYPIYINPNNDNSSQYFFYISENTLKAYKKVSGSNTVLASTAYNSTNHKWFRIRESGGTTYFDTSADGLSWTNFTSTANAFSVTAVGFGAMAGTWSTEASTTTATMDNFNYATSPAVTLSDDWATGSIDTGKWLDWGSPQTSVSSEELHVTSVTGGGYFGVDSDTGGHKYNLTDSQVVNEVVNAGNQGLSTWEVYPLYVYLDGDNSTQYFYYISGNTLKAYKKVSGSNTVLASTTYNSTNHKWFRIRESGGTTYFDTSPDGGTWSNFASTANAFNVTQVGYGAMAGTWDTEASTTTAVFDNMNTWQPVYVYDENGNLTSDGYQCYEYNDANQLKKVTECGNGQTLAEYIYDYNGSRMVKKDYLSGSLKKTVVSWSDQYETSTEVGGSPENTSYYFVNGELAAKKDPNGDRFYYHNDHLGSASVMTDENGDTVEETSYDPWGELDSGGTASKFLYTGQEYDAETGLNYYGARYYSSGMRRFTQPDDVVQHLYNPQLLNRYSYVQNNPLKYTDPTGHISILDYNNALTQYHKDPSILTYNNILNTVSAIQQTKSTSSNNTNSTNLINPKTDTKPGNTFTSSSNASVIMVRGISFVKPSIKNFLPQKGYLDVSFSSGLLGPLGGGIGAQVNRDGFIPYISGGALTPGKGVALTYSKEDPERKSNSVNFGITLAPVAANVSYPYVNEFVPVSSGEVSLGLGYPFGLSVTVNHTFSSNDW